MISDKAVSDVCADDVLDFRVWWMERIQVEGLSANAANKDLTHVGDVLKTVNKMKRLGLVLPRNDLSFKQGEADKRPPFCVDWIVTRLLAGGALDGLNDQAQAILSVMINTGARPSELAALIADCIRLDDPVPHFSIEAVGRQLESKNVKRLVPLAASSLAALTGFPKRFGRCRGSSASLSATINKFLRLNGLFRDQWPLPLAPYTGSWSRLIQFRVARLDQRCLPSSRKDHRQLAHGRGSPNSFSHL